MSKLWKTILLVAGVGLVIAMLIAGFIVPLAAVVLLLLAMGIGALLYRTAGPPEQ